MPTVIGAIKLQQPTPNAWILAAQSQLSVLLSDHAVCEKKAATMALSLMKYFYEYPDILQKLSKIAREELVHYEQVLRFHKKMQWDFQPKPACRYAKTLWQAIERDSPYSRIDQLMICAVIEARSCERFSCLAPVIPEPLSTYYAKLYQAEKRHAEIYIDFAAQLVDYTVIQTRLDRILTVEASVVTAPEAIFRFHSGVPVI